MSQSHVFSSAITRIGAPGNTALTSANILGVNQEFSFNTTPKRTDLFDAAQNSVRAVDTADDQVKDSVKISNKDVQLAVMAYQTGGSVATSGGNTTLTVGGLNVPQFCRLEAVLVDSAGNTYNFVATKAKPKGLDVSAKIGDFADNAIEFDLYPDPNAAVANTAYTFELVPA